jgi:hypothetical protein
MVARMRAHHHYLERFRKISKLLIGEGVMRWSSVTTALFCSLALTLPAAAQTQAPVKIDDFVEIRQHELSTNEYAIPTEWRDAPRLRQQTYGGQWTVGLIVDEIGAVVSAEIDPRHSAREHWKDVRVAALRLRFTPFERDGRPVRAAFTTFFWAKPADYTGPPDRAFPDVRDLSQVRIRLERTGCYGSCPSYQVEIDGAGNVLYRGDEHVLARGQHRWTIPESGVRELLQLFRRADYFRLDGYYRINATDLPTYITGLDIGRQRKFVLDYGWGGMGEAVASTSFGGFEGERMPPVVSEIEQAIDRLSGVQAYVRGDDTSASRLRAEGWDFRSLDNGGVALAQLILDCNIAVARAFLAEGAPLLARRRYFEDRVDIQPIVLLAPGCGDPGFIEELVNRGALRDKPTADAFLAAAAASGYPGIVALALQHSRNFSQGDGGLLNAAVMAYGDEENPNHARFSEAGVVRLLLEAGADPRAKDRLLGDTPLHHVSDVETARLLIAAGADPNARNSAGETPLFNSYFPEIYPVLVAAGADVSARDGSGYTAVYVANSPEAIRALVALGANVNDIAPDGKTPIEVVGNAEAMQAMLDAGARLPEERERIAAIVAQTAYWDALPPALAERAAALGLAKPVPQGP